MPNIWFGGNKDLPESSDKLRLSTFIDASCDKVLKIVGLEVTTNENKDLLDKLVCFLLQLNKIKCSILVEDIIKNINMGRQYLLVDFSVLNTSKIVGISDEKRSKLKMELEQIGLELANFLKPFQEKLAVQDEPSASGILIRP